jgi:hypothetical protein
MKTGYSRSVSTIVISAAALTFAMTASAAAQEVCGAGNIGRGPDTGTGCMVIGQGPTVVDPCCTYPAPSGEPENVFAVTRDSFSIYVVRQCPEFAIGGCTPTLEADECTPTPDNTCQPLKDASGNVIYGPKTITLMEVTDAEAANTDLARLYRGKIHPFEGETVNVYFGAGKAGFISAGQDEALMNAAGMSGGLPLPDPPPL